MRVLIESLPSGLWSVEVDGRMTAVPKAEVLPLVEMALLFSDVPRKHVVPEWLAREVAIGNAKGGVA